MIFTNIPTVLCAALGSVWSKHRIHSVSSWLRDVDNNVLVSLVIDNDLLAMSVDREVLTGCVDNVMGQGMLTIFWSEVVDNELLSSGCCSDILV